MDLITGIHLVIHKHSQGNFYELVSGFWFWGYKGE